MLLFDLCWISLIGCYLVVVVVVLLLVFFSAVLRCLALGGWDCCMYYCSLLDLRLLVIVCCLCFLASVLQCP